jgi:hypothetical protein
VDVLVLAGTHTDPSKLIGGRNKAFLPMGEAVCLGHVLDALRRARRVGRVFVVGPVEELTARLPSDVWGYTPVPQAGRMLDNAWAAYREAESALPPGSSAAERADRPYLILTSDVPLAVPEAIDDFIERAFSLQESAGERIDFFAGLADEVALAPFYPRPPRRGIRRPYMELRRHRLRLANIYLLRPGRIRNLEILQQGFSARKLTRWRSVLRLISVFLRNPGGIRGVAHVVCLQIAALFEWAGLRWLVPIPSALVPLPVVERSASMMLGCRFRALVTPYGGLSVDIDDDADYQILQENLTVWREHQRTLIPPLGPEDQVAAGPGPAGPRPPAVPPEATA